jgi:hypothetical protein
MPVGGVRRSAAEGRFPSGNRQGPAGPGAPGIGRVRVPHRGVLRNGQDFLHRPSAASTPRAPAGPKCRWPGAHWGHGRAHVGHRGTGRRAGMRPAA